MGHLVTVIALNALVNSVPNRLLNSEFSVMETSQKRLIHIMQSYVGSAAIYASFIIILINSQILLSASILFPDLKLDDFGWGVLTLIPVFLAFVHLYHRVKMSSKIASELTLSLVDSKWRKKYSQKRASIT